MFGPIFKEKEPELFKKYWDEYVEKNKVSPRYTFLALENLLEMSKSREFFRADKSFVLVRDKIPLACVPLIIEEQEGRRTISFSGHYLPAPIFSDDKVCKDIFPLIDQIAAEEKAAKISLFADVLESENHPYNFLQRFGYLNSSLLNNVVDLSGDLFKTCREGHRRVIKKIADNPDFSTFFTDRTNADYAVHEKYRDLHFKSSGRRTRSKASFDSQFERLKAGLAAIFAIKYKREIVGACYFESHGKKALFGSGAEDPEYEKLPLYHSMIFAALSYYKERGFKLVELSQPFNPGAQFDYYPDEKQKNIGAFKRGFGGKWANEYRGVKYFDKELFLKECEEFKNNYSKTIGGEETNGGGLKK